MRIKGKSAGLIASLFVLVASGWFGADFALRAAMAYYSDDPARGAAMRRLEHYAVIASVVLVLAAAASIVFGIFVFRARKQAPLERSSATHAHSENQSWVVDRGGQVIE